MDATSVLVPALLVLLNLTVGVIGAYVRLAFRDLCRRLAAIERLHQEHVTWHMNMGR